MHLCATFWNFCWENSLLFGSEVSHLKSESQIAEKTKGERRKAKTKNDVSIFFVIWTFCFRRFSFRSPISHQKSGGTIRANSKKAKTLRANDTKAKQSGENIKKLLFDHFVIRPFYFCHRLVPQISSYLWISLGIKSGYRFVKPVKSNYRRVAHRYLGHLLKALDIFESLKISKDLKEAILKSSLKRI